jgi:hypothetical protein
MEGRKGLIVDSGVSVSWTPSKELDASASSASPEAFRYQQYDGKEEETFISPKNQVSIFHQKRTPTQVCSSNTLINWESPEEYEEALREIKRKKNAKAHVSLYHKLTQSMSPSPTSKTSTFTIEKEEIDDFSLAGIRSVNCFNHFETFHVILWWQSTYWPLRSKI